MVFHPSDYSAPSTFQEVVRLLAAHGKHARIIAGGTAIYELAKRGLASEVQHLISLRKLPLKYVRRDQEGFHVGSTTTLAELAAALDLEGDQALGALRDALREIRPTQVRSVATVGGEVCTSLPLLDLPPALLAVDSQVTLHGQNGRRTIPLSEFMVDFFLTALRRDEFLEEVKIPTQPEHSASAFLKFGRTAYDFNLVNVAARISLSRDGGCIDARIYVGGVGRVPMRATASEFQIINRQIDDSTVSRASEALGEFKAIPQLHGDAEYKREIARILLRDCIRLAEERATVLAR